MLPRGTSPLGLQDDSGFQGHLLSRNDNSGRISSGITNASPTPSFTQVFRVYCLLTWLCTTKVPEQELISLEKKKGAGQWYFTSLSKTICPKDSSKMHLYFVIMKVITNIHSFTFRFEDLKIEMSFYQGDTFAIKHYRWGFHINVDNSLLRPWRKKPRVSWKSQCLGSPTHVCWMNNCSHIQQIKTAIDK